METLTNAVLIVSALSGTIGLVIGIEIGSHKRAILAWLCKGKP